MRVTIGEAIMEKDAPSTPLALTQSMPLLVIQTCNVPYIPMAVDGTTHLIFSDDIQKPFLVMLAFKVESA